MDIVSVQCLFWQAYGKWVEKSFLLPLLENYQDEWDKARPPSNASQPEEVKEAGQ